VVRKGAPLRGLPALDPNAKGVFSIGLKAQDFFRAGFLPGDTVTVTVPETGKHADDVHVVRWADANCAAWLSTDLQAELELPVAKSQRELVLRRPDPNASGLRVTIIYPLNGAYVQGGTDLIARIENGQGQVKEVQFFVFAPDEWKYYVTPSQRVTLTGTTFIRATTYLGRGPEDDGREFYVWADIRDTPEPVDSKGVLGRPQVSSRVDRIVLTRGSSDTDNDCIPDAEEISDGTNPYDANDPCSTPLPQGIDCCDECNYPVNWIHEQNIAVTRVFRGDELGWLQVDWKRELPDANYAILSRTFDPPIRMEFCQKIKADIQAQGAQRIKVELKNTKAADDPNRWVWTETFVFEAGEFQTVVVDAPKLWGNLPAERGAFDLQELTFTIDRRHENALSGTYWLRNIRLVGRPCGSCSN